jgi:uncharacterized membrane-anchored protein
VQRTASLRADAFYWVAILASNTLGTALGNFLADASGLGFAASASLIAGGIVVTALALRVTPLSGVLLFWVAFMMSRPFVATFGDLPTRPVSHGGLAQGAGGAWRLLAVLPFASLLIQRGRQDRLSAPNAPTHRNRAGGTGPAGSTQ